MSTTTGKTLNLVKPELTDDHKVTIGTDLPANFQKIDDAVTAHLADTAKHATAWQTWTPTLTWTTATPGTITTTARYCTIGKVCFFSVYINAADGNGATNLTITLPVNLVANNMYPPVNSQQRIGVDGGVINPYGWIYDNGSNNTINFFSFATCTSGQILILKISGFYEIA